MPTTALAVSSPASNAMSERELSCEKQRSLRNSKQACGTRRDEEEILAGFAFALGVMLRQQMKQDVMTPSMSGHFNFLELDT